MIFNRRILFQMYANGTSDINELPALRRTEYYSWSSDAPTQTVPPNLKAK